MELSLINIILTSSVLCAIIIFVVFKNKSRIKRFFEKKQVIRFIVSVLIPFIIPFILSIIFAVDEGWFDKSKHNSVNLQLEIFTILMIVISFFNLAFQFIIWCREKKEDDIYWENFAAKQAFNNIYEIFMGKMIQMRSAYHNGLKQGMLTDSDIPYNIFEQIRKTTWEFCRTISKITNIPTKDLDAAFIYHYSYKGVTPQDAQWKWITGKGSKFGLNLNDFIGDTDSTFHYLISNNISTLFYNDKTKAFKEQEYQYTYKDHNHKCVGSFVAAKIAFSSNDDTLCEGIVMINSYGKRFLDSDLKHTEEELMHLILDSIFPCYRQLLSCELAMLYFRHQVNGSTDEMSKTERKKTAFPFKYSLRKKCVKCIISTTKRIWSKH